MGSVAQAFDLGPKEPNSSEINWSRLSVVPITCSMMGRAQGAFQ